MACAALALITQDVPVWQIGFVASFVSKLSDTVSSEIGKVSAGPPFKKQISKISINEANDKNNLPQ